MPKPEDEPVLLDVSVFPRLFRADAPEGAVIAAVLVETRGEAFSGTLELSGPDAGQFTLYENLIVLAAPAAVGDYAITITARQGDDAIISPQVLLCRDRDGTEPPVDPEEPEPPEDEVVVCTFALDNPTSTVSAGEIRIGLVFVAGDVPPGNALGLRRDGLLVLAQFDQVSSRAEGVITCSCCLSDEPWAPGESRLYEVVTKPGSNDRTSFAQLEDAPDLKLLFTNVTGSTSGPIADFAVELHPYRPTRVTKYESGPVCTSWEVWTTPPGRADPSIVWYVSAWASGAWEVAAEVGQVWWSPSLKERLSYTAELIEGQEVIACYEGVQHGYHACWLTVDMRADDWHGTRHWLYGARATLVYKPDREYWIKSGLIPPFDLARSYVMPAGYAPHSTYVPGSPQSHRGAVDATGAYTGRGILPNQDTIAFLTQLPQDVRVARIAAFAGPHVPYHRRSNRYRSRPGETEDIARTLCALRLDDERGANTPPEEYDFRADGMPQAVHAYADHRTPSANRDGFLAPSGGHAHGWAPSGDATHAVNYSYFMYLYEGERHFYNATLDLGMNCVQQRIGDIQAALGPLQWYDIYARTPIYPGTPDVKWSGLGMNLTYNNRGNGWAANNISAMHIVADDDVQAGFVRKLISHNAKWAAMSAEYIPDNCPGVYVAGGALQSPWMEAIQGMGYYSAFARTGDDNWLKLAHFIARSQIAHAAQGRIWLASAYQGVTRPNMQQAWNATTNEWFLDYYDKRNGFNIATDGTITMDLAPSYGMMQYRAGDTVVPHAVNTSGVATPIPPELVQGRAYYVVQPTGGKSFKLAATPGGTPITYAAPCSNMSAGISLADFYGSGGTYVPPDGYFAMSWCVAVLAERYGHPDPSIAEAADIYEDVALSTDNTSWATWSYGRS